VAWAAGLFDGEGSTCLLDHGSHAGFFVGEMSVTQASQSGVPEVLERFRSVMRRGNVTGPVVYHDCPTYRWKTYSLDDIASTFHLLAPQLGTVKRTQSLRVIQTLVAQIPLARGNPAWGRHKTHCIHGHEYASMRVRAYRARGVGRGPKRSQCLVCVRLAAKRRRDGKRSGGP
jgi:hypothetical protein